MSDYLDHYGVDEARRERFLKRAVVAVIVVAALGGLLYWKFKDYREERQITAFFELLRKQDYQAAYSMWGCTQQAPCQQYSFEKFMEDWGPGNSRGDLSSVRLGGTRSCPDGVIQTMTLGEEEIWLWVGRSDHILSYAPWPVCQPHLPPGTDKPTG
jgi:hypothetical protein